MRAQLRRVAERHLPRDRAAIEVDRHEVAVGRLEERNIVDRRRLAAIDVLRIDFIETIFRLRGGVELLDLENRRLSRRLDVETSSGRIERTATPVRAADHA